MVRHTGCTEQPRSRVRDEMRVSMLRLAIPETTKRLIVLFCRQHLSPHFSHRLREFETATRTICTELLRNRVRDEMRVSMSRLAILQRKSAMVFSHDFCPRIPVWTNSGSVLI